MRKMLIAVLLLGQSVMCKGQSKVADKIMEKIFEEVKTPYKYGVVIAQPDSSTMIDSPTVFRSGNQWYMTYITFDGKGYQTYLSKSEDLLTWKPAGRIMSFTENTWDATQKAGYVGLVDITWGGSYEPEKFQGKYWLSYLGGSQKGYEAGQLGVGLATSDDLNVTTELKRLPKPVLSSSDQDAKWYDDQTIYKSLVIRDDQRITGYPFVMYYNAKGKKPDAAGHGFESIAMAVSEDMQHWKRTGSAPLVTRNTGICGDAQIAKIGDLYVMFYFGAFWKPGAFERFACSYDLVNWTDWKGADLIQPSEPYDQTYAHKPWVVKWNGIVYHFYNAVGDQGRVIALATSKDLRAGKNKK